MFVLCAGMYRSGSTWQYQVVTHLLEHAGGCQRLGFLEGKDFAQTARQAPEAPWRVVKTHEGHPDFAFLLAGGAAVGVCSYRDLRDAVFSMAHKTSRAFSDVAFWAVAACKSSFAFWTSQPGMLLQRYDLIRDEPARAVQQLAAFLKVPLRAGEAEEIAREFSLDANRSRATVLREQLEAKGVDLSDPANALLHDPHTQVHWNHIREGKSGGWRDQAGSAERIFLARTCGSWLVEHQFESDPLWRLIEETDLELQRFLDPTDQAEAELLQAVEQREATVARALRGLLSALEERHAEEQGTWNSVAVSHWNDAVLRARWFDIGDRLRTIRADFAENRSPANRAAIHEHYGKIGQRLYQVWADVTACQDQCARTEPAHRELHAA